jgi:hypothetical protein
MKKVRFSLLAASMLLALALTVSCSSDDGDDKKEDNPVDNPGGNPGDNPGGSPVGCFMEGGCYTNYSMVNTESKCQSYGLTWGECPADWVKCTFVGTNVGIAYLPQEEFANAVCAENQ